YLVLLQGLPSHYAADGRQMLFAYRPVVLRFRRIIKKSGVPLLLELRARRYVENAYVVKALVVKSALEPGTVLERHSRPESKIYCVGILPSLPNHVAQPGRKGRVRYGFV